MPTTCVGVSGSVAGQCSVPKAGEFVTGAGLLVACQGIENDIASLNALKVAKAGDIMTGVLDVVNGTGTSITTSGQINAGGDVLLDANAFTLSVSNATVATPIVITTTVAHKLADGDQVAMAGVSVGGSSGQWVVKVTGYSATTFALVDSVGSGSYTGGGTVQRDAQIMFSAARTTTRALTRFWNDGTGNGVNVSSWYVNNQGVFQSLASSPTSAPQYFGADIDLPQGSTLLSGTVYLQPAGSHSAVPANLPTVHVYKISLLTGVATLLATQADLNTSSTTAYQAYTAITATLGTAEIMDVSRFRYIVILNTESGTSALQGTQVFGASCSVTSPSVAQF